MRLIPAVLFVFGGAFCGYMASRAYKKRVEILLCCELLLERMMALLSLENLPTNVIFARLSAMPELKALSFVQKTAAGLCCSCDFPSVFQTALKDGAEGLRPEDSAILLRLAGLVGSYELSRQLDGIAAVKELLRIQREKAAEEQRRNGKTVRSLGILGGIAAAIFVI